MKISRYPVYVQCVHECYGACVTIQVDDMATAMCARVSRGHILAFVYTHSGEGMKTLLSMIQSQNKAWNDRLEKREERISSPPQPMDTVEQQADSLSVCTLSTRYVCLSQSASRSPVIFAPMQGVDFISYC